MKPEQCSFCRGELNYGKTDFIARVEDKIISIKNIPAYVCCNCTESYFTVEVSRKIDMTMKDFHQGKFFAHPIAAGELEFDMNSGRMKEELER